MAIVTIDYNDLINDNVSLISNISEAYGYDGLGILTVSNIPNLNELRMKLLPLARKFADLDENIKNKYVHEESKYSFGWSHGKEKLQSKPDLSKGSYYANPQYDRPIDDEEIIKAHEAFVHPNIWPKDDLPELERAFKELGQLIVSVGILVAKLCDAYVKSQCPSYKEMKLTEIIKSSKCCKARLLHYFPQNEEELSNNGSNEDSSFSSWCGWHNDHGSITGLVSAIYMNENGDIVNNADSESGLYVRNRKSELVKVPIPSDHIAFQIGETAQIHSGGILQATPHAVRGTKIPKISRETFAVFMEPMWMEPMDTPEGTLPEAAQSQSAAENLPKGVPSLKSRWDVSQTFGDFTTKTLDSYY